MLEISIIQLLPYDRTCRDDVLKYFRIQIYWGFRLCKWCKGISMGQYDTYNLPLCKDMYSIRIIRPGEDWRIAAPIPSEGVMLSITNDIARTALIQCVTLELEPWALIATYRQHSAQILVTHAQLIN
jgi:hypothetical protein